MNKFHIFVLVLFGFLLMPNNSFGCENNSAKQTFFKRDFPQKWRRKTVAKMTVIQKLKIMKVAEENATILNVVVLLLATHLFLLMN